MYKYIKQWPKDREHGWSEELQGVCHDDNNWFFTQDGKLWKFPITHRIGDKVTSENKAKGILRNKYGHHLGDFDCCNGYLFIPVTGDGKPYIAVFSANDLSFVMKQEIKRNGAYFKSLGWCAVNPNDKRLYTSDKHCKNQFGSDCSPVLIYDIDFAVVQKKSGEFLKYRTALMLKDEKGNVLTREHMQGGCFDNENHLHINNGYYTSVTQSWANDKGGISVFKIPSYIAANSTPFVIRIARSYQSGIFRYQFNGKGQEPEGITYWDLNKDKRAPEISGVLHAIMLDNLGIRDDDFYFKHYDRV